MARRLPQSRIVWYSFSPTTIFPSTNAQGPSEPPALAAQPLQYLSPSFIPSHFSVDVFVLGLMLPLYVTASASPHAAHDDVRSSVLNCMRNIGSDIHTGRYLRELFLCLWENSGINSYT